MAGSSSTYTLRIRRWRGLHECPDGDTGLEPGEAAVMQNFRITRDGSLKKRGGTRTRFALTQSGEPESGKAVRALWQGTVGGTDKLIAACDGCLWDCSGAEETVIGHLSTAGEVFLFPFNGKLYILNGCDYYVYDGLTLSAVSGYVPLVRVTCTADGGGTALEQINKLTPTRRFRISPDGSSCTYPMPEKALASLDKVIKTADGTAISGCTCDLQNGTLTFPTPPEAGVDSLEVTYSVSSDFRSQITAMHYAEVYNGSTDERVFLYGDGGCAALYSGLDGDGNSRADYFPDLNVLTVGNSSSPITAMIRHYSQLIVFKADSTWTVQYGAQTLPDGTVTAAFYVIPVNRTVGCSTPGQVRLVLNSPYTLFNGQLYEWRNSNTYAANLTLDERQAYRISDRVYATLSGMREEKCRCFDDNRGQEYYICCGDQALIYNYAADAWYVYTGFDAYSMAFDRERVFFGTSDGVLKELSDTLRSDDGKSIRAYWESGDMDMNEGGRTKNSALLWVGIKPESRSALTVTVRTDREGESAGTVEIKSLAGFEATDFSAWSFSMNRRPKVRRLRLKARKFVFYKLCFSSEAPDTTVTVLSATVELHHSGYAR